MLKRRQENALVDYRIAGTVEACLASEQRRRSDNGIVMSGRIWTPPDCNGFWQRLVPRSQLLTYIRLLYAA